MNNNTLNLSSIFNGTLFLLTASNLAMAFSESSIRPFVTSHLQIQSYKLINVPNFNLFKTKTANTYMALSGTIQGVNMPKAIGTDMTRA